LVNDCVKNEQGAWKRGERAGTATEIKFAKTDNTICQLTKAKAILFTDR
jgi:hypothetical protein